MAIPTWSLCSSTALLSQFTRRPLAQKRDSASVHWLIPRRADHKDGEIGGELGTLIGFGFPLLPGQTYSSKGVAPLLKTVAFGALLADKAFDTNGLVTKLDARSNSRHPAKGQAANTRGPCNREAYKCRHLIENVFASTKEYRGVPPVTTKPTQRCRTLELGPP